MKAILGFLAMVFVVGMTAAAILAAAVVQLVAQLLPLLVLAGVVLAGVRLLGGRRSPSPRPVGGRPVVPPASVGALGGRTARAVPPLGWGHPPAGRWVWVPRPPVIDAEVIEDG